VEIEAAELLGIGAKSSVEIVAIVSSGVIRLRRFCTTTVCQYLSTTCHFRLRLWSDFAKRLHAHLLRIFARLHKERAVRRELNLLEAALPNC